MFARDYETTSYDLKGLYITGYPKPTIDHTSDSPQNYQPHLPRCCTGLSILSLMNNQP